jgi:hypothetical protein
MQRCRAILCLLPGAWVLACGGRYQQTVEGDDAPSAGTASGGRRTGEAGGSSRAGSTSRAGNPAGGSSGVGGSVGTAGSTATGGSGPIICACDPIACVPPFRAVPQVNGCCYYCELDLMQCAQASDDYRQLRQQMIDKYNSLGCMIDADCTIYYDQHSSPAERERCGVASCGVPLLASMVNEVDRNLESYAQSSCSPACPGAPELPCAPVAPRCVMSRCQ